MVSPKKLFACPKCKNGNIKIDVPMRITVDSRGFVKKIDKRKRFIPSKEETFQIDAQCDNIECGFWSKLNSFLEPETTKEKLDEIRRIDEHDEYKYPYRFKRTYRL
jgi:hypothetical protein